jgi:hypothetical protein
LQKNKKNRALRQKSKILSGFGAKPTRQKPARKQRKTENGKWKMETLPSFSIFRFPFSVDKARASAFLMLSVQSLKTVVNQKRNFKF